MSTIERINRCLIDIGSSTARHEEQKFREDLGLESIECLELAIALEDEFGFEIPEEVYDNGQLTTVKQAIEYLDKRLAE